MSSAFLIFPGYQESVIDLQGSSRQFYETHHLGPAGYAKLYMEVRPAAK
jgi:hypothetical protein